MALILTFQNDRTGNDAASNYDVRVFVNQRQIGRARVEGHKRSDDWLALVRRLVEQIAIERLRDHQ